jgi:DNA-binding transcriptional regulator GbsR (MarR family)
MGYEVSLVKLLGVLYVAGQPLDFNKIYEASELTRPCLSRGLEKGERLGFLERIRDEEARKSSWAITQRGKRIYNLMKTVD